MYDQDAEYEYERQWWEDTMPLPDPPEEDNEDTKE